MRPPAADPLEDADPSPESPLAPDREHVELASERAPDAQLPVRRRKRVTQVHMDGADAGVTPEPLDAEPDVPDA